eukprot:2791511-Pleurochrysis_carterae.AAC.4
MDQRLHIADEENTNRYDAQSLRRARCRVRRVCGHRGRRARRPRPASLAVVARPPPRARSREQSSLHLGVEVTLDYELLTDY